MLMGSSVMVITAGVFFSFLFFFFFFFRGGGGGRGCEHGVRGGGSSRNSLYRGEKCMITVYQTPLKLSGTL